MKKIFDKRDIKIIIIIFILIALDVFLFFISKLLLGDLHLIGSKIDEAIPFLPGFIYIYISWYIALVIIPFYVFKRNENSFKKYVLSYIISTIICAIIFVAYPNTIQRATVSNEGITNILVKIIYLLDTPVNCLPSIHCLYSFLYIFSIFDTKEKTSIYLKIIITIFSIGIVLSTFFIKQHVIYDAVASLIISIIVWLIVDKFKIYKCLEKYIN